MKRRRNEPRPGVSDALDDVVTLGPGRLDDDAVADAVSLRRQVADRLGRGEGLTVAAVAGGTGVGKSALVNALLGREVTAEGVRRPTTSVALAAAPDQDGPTTALLDWLEVPERHTVADALPAGLVLLDLPDHDSVVESHRRTAARLAQRVDVVVWVLDPIKYARADAHGGPLAALTEHADVLVVVLNRIDELPAGEVDAVVADVHARLAAGGHRGARVVPTSAATGEGLAELRGTLADIARTRTAATARLHADAAMLGVRLREELEELPDLVLDLDTWVPPLVEAVDGHRAVAEAARAARRDALQRARSPLARAARAPLRGLVGAYRGGPEIVGRAHVPMRATVEARVQAAVNRHVGTAAVVGRTHLALDGAVVDASSDAAPALLDAVAGTGLAPPRSRWPVALATLRGLAEATALVGALWLTALAATSWLQLPELPTPDAVGALPWPTALLLGGLAVRVLLGVITRLLARRAAARHGARISGRVERSVRAAAEQHLLAPVREELAAQARLRDAVAALAHVPAPGGVRR